MIGLRWGLVGLLVMSAGWRGGEKAVTPTEKVRLERLDPGLDVLVSPDAMVARQADGFRWVEGPVWIPYEPAARSGGYLLFAEIRSNSIRKLVPGQDATVWLQPSGYRGAEPYGGPEPGTNGMTLDGRGRLTIAGHGARNVTRLETMDPAGRMTVLADRFKGEPLNSPNDVVYGRDGSAYFTDPPYGLRTQDDKDPEKKLAFNGVFRIPHATAQKAGAEPRRGELQALIKDLPRPNGICFSPDGKTLYVNDTSPKFWMKYPVKADGTLGGGSMFADARNDNRPGSPDGMKVDTAGNVYSAGPGGVWILSPEGKHLGTILVDKSVSNVAWGGEDGRTLFVTATDRVLSVRMLAGGIPGR